MKTIIKERYQKSIETQMRALESLVEPLNDAGELIIHALYQGQKIVVAGLGFSYTNAEVMVNHFLSHINVPRPIFNAVLLGTSSDLRQEGDQLSLAHELEIIGMSGDVLIVFCESRASRTLLNAIDVAIEKDLKIIAFSSYEDDSIGSKLAPDDVNIIAPSHSRLGILESHFVAQNILCDVIEHRIIVGD